MILRFLSADPHGREMMLQTEPVGRFGTPQEVANAAAWLCSSEASFVTGVPVPIDGAWLPSNPHNFIGSVT